MKIEGASLATRVLRHVLAGEEREFTFPLRGELGGRTEEFEEPALTVQEVNAIALSEELFVELAVRQECYYVLTETGLVERVSLNHRVSQLFPVPGIAPGNRVEVMAEVLPHGSWRAMEAEGQRSAFSVLAGDCRVKLAYTVYDERPFILEPPGEETPVTSEAIEIESFCAECRHTIDIALPVELGHVSGSVGVMSGKLVNIKATAVPGWVRLEGDVIASLPYIDTAGEKRQESFVLSLLRYLEFPEAQPGMTVAAEGRTELFACRREPENAEGVVRGLLHIKTRLYETEALAVPERPRSHGQSGKQNPFLLEEVIAVGSSQTLIQREIVFTRPARKVREPVEATVRNLTHEIIGNKVIVRGVLHKEIFAVEAATGAVFAQEADEPFVHFVDAPGARPGMRAHVRARVEFVNIEIRPGGATARQVTIIEIIVKVTKFIKKEIMLPLPLLPVPKPHPTPPPAGRIYIVRTGDSIWKIAHMFGISLQSLIAANNLQNPNLIFPGQKLIIPG